MPLRHLPGLGGGTSCSQSYTQTQLENTGVQRQLHSSEADISDVRHRFQPPSLAVKVWPESGNGMGSAADIDMRSTATECKAHIVA